MPLQYKWTRNGIPIDGAESPTYTLTPDDAEKTICCEITGVNEVCSVMVATDSVVTPGLAPVNVVRPDITGVASVGSTLTLSNVGTWTGAPTITYTYQWRRNGDDIPLENGLTYVIQSGDVGTVIDCVVTGTNLYGLDEEPSNFFIPCAGSTLLPPQNTVPPVISYVSLLAGSTLTCSQGTWIGTAPITYSYQWKKDGINIPLANTNTYVIASGDEGHNIVCDVIAANVVTAISAESNVIVPVVGPAFVTTPIIYGDEVVGSVLTCSSGTISGTGPITISYNWQYSVDNITWVDFFPVQIGSTYTIVSIDLKRYIRCQVSVSNAYGTANSVSNVLLLAKAPVNTLAPGISGLLNVPGTLNVNVGGWDGTGPFTYDYQWQRNGVDIFGETGSTYTTSTPDIGQNITVRVGATNIVTTNYAESSTPFIPYGPPVNIQPPVIYGIYAEGQTLTVQDGVYSGYPIPTITRKWQYSTNGGTTWNDYSPPETGNTYTVQTGETGRLIRVVETATNTVGTPNIDSNIATIQNTNSAPAITGVPTISGNRFFSQTLTANVAGVTVTGTPTPTVTYQWFRNGVAISGATSLTYTLSDILDVGANITFRVIATNVGGTTFVISAITTIIETIADKHPTSVAHGWAMFLLRGAYFSSPIMRVRRTSDNATVDVFSDANGLFNTATVSSHCGTSEGYVTILYDQIGGQNFTQSNNAQQFRIWTGTAIETIGTPANNCMSSRVQTTPSSSSGGIMSVVGSAAASTFNFLHDGTTTFSLFSVATNVGIVSMTNSLANTMSGNSTGFQWNFVASGVTGSGTGTLRAYNPTPSLILSSSVSSQIWLDTKALYLSYVAINYSQLPPFQRARGGLNKFNYALNNQGGAVTTGNPTLDLTIGGLGGTNNTNPHQFVALLMYKTENNVYQVRNTLATQVNLS